MGDRPTSVTDPPVSDPPPGDPQPRAGDAPPRERELADWGVRAAAQVLDTLLLAGIVLIVLVAVRVAAPDATRHTLEVFAYAVGIPLGLAYAPGLMARRGARNGQTLGRQAMRIRVVCDDGKPMTIGRGLLREVIGRQLLLAITFYVYAPIDYLWPLWDKANQTIHDKVGSTRVMRVAEASGGGAGRFAPRPVPPPAPRAPADEQPVRGWLPPAPS
jgi:uncharacterized RDD family membrane protein YckC